MKGYRVPTVVEMAEAYQAVKSIGLKNIRLGNVGLFASTEGDLRYLAAHVDVEAY